MKFGTLQGVLGEPLPDVFAVAKELGFDGVELDWHQRSQAQTGGPLGPEQRPIVRAAAHAAGIEISSVAAHFLNSGGLASADEETQQQGLEGVWQGIELCRDLGATVLLVPFFGAATIEGDAGIERLTANLKQLEPEAEAAGVTLTIEHSLRGDQAAALLTAVGSPHVGDYWDMANCMCFGYDPLREIESLRGHLAQVHAKEYDRGDGPAGSPDDRSYRGLNTKPFGGGQVPVREVLAALRKSGYDGYVVLETGAFGDRKESARAALEVLRAAV